MAALQSQVTQMFASARVFGNGQVFDPQDLDALTRAFQRSCDILSAENDVRFRSSGAAYYAREVLARVIIGQASSGNRDPVSLSDGALGYMSVR